MEDDADTLILEVPVAAVMRYSAYHALVWPIREQITQDEVRACVEPLDRELDWMSKDYRRRDLHIARVAYFVQNEIENPVIVFDFCGDNWPVQDGNHRLAAMIAKGCETIKVDPGGFYNQIVRAFPDHKSQIDLWWSKP